MGTRGWKRSMGLRPVDFYYTYREESNKTKGKKWHYLVWLGQILAAVLLGRFILLCMAPHHACISSLPQSVGVPRHRISVYCSWHSSQATNGWSLVQPYRGTAVKSLSLYSNPPWLRLLEWCGRHSLCLHLTHFSCLFLSLFDVGVWIPFSQV